MKDEIRVYFYGGPNHGEIKTIKYRSHIEVSLNDETPFQVPKIPKRSFYERTVRKVFRVRDESLMVPIDSIRRFTYRVEIIRKNLSCTRFREAFVCVPVDLNIYDAEKEREIVTLLDLHRMFEDVDLPPSYSL